MSFNREIKCSLNHFIQHFNLNISYEDFDDFILKDQKRKSLDIVPHDAIDLIEDYLLIPDVLALVVVSSVLYNRIDQVRMKIVQWAYPMNILPKEPLYQWKHFGIDKFEHMMEDEEIHSEVLEITKVEKTIKYCTTELEKLEQPAFNPLPQTIRGIQIYKAQLRYEKNDLNDLWSKLSTKTREFLDAMKWLYHPGFITDMKEVDQDLYGGISKKELDEQSHYVDNPEDEYVENLRRWERDEDWYDDEIRREELEGMGSYGEEYDEWIREQG